MTPSILHLDLTGLRTLIALADSGSFSLAAVNLHISQSAVSKRIAQLEQTLGTTLLQRQGRRVTLTAAGERVDALARRTLDDWRDCNEALRALDNGDHGTLALATSHYMGLTHLPPLLGHFTRRRPKVHLKLRFLDSDSACQQVHERALDLALVTLPDRLAPELEAIHLWEDQLVIAIHRDLAPLGHNTSIQALAQLPALLPPRDSATRQRFQEVWDPTELPLRIVAESNFLKTLAALVSERLGWALLPQAMVTPPMLSITLPGPAIYRNLGLVRPKLNAEPALVSAFITLAKAAACGVPRGHYFR